MTDEANGKPEPDRVTEELATMSGQSYIEASDAFQKVAQFCDEVVKEYALDNSGYSQTHYEKDPRDVALRALSVALEEEQRPAADARGTYNVMPHQQVVCVSEASGIIVEALGGERSDVSMPGTGFTMDERHDENVEKIADLRADD